jgi:hypothetical protein
MTWRIGRPGAQVIRSLEGNEGEKRLRIRGADALLLLNCAWMSIYRTDLPIAASVTWFLPQSTLGSRKARNQVRPMKGRQPPRFQSTRA